MSERILIVDDDSDILEILSYLLSEAGYETRTLTHGETIANDIKEYEPNLILMDVMLAGMDGRAICQSLKVDPSTRELPVILISGTHDLAKSLHLPGAPDDFIAKPFVIDVLLEKIAQHFHN
jgi:DNA-binding response OmpR family regulator